MQSHSDQGAENKSKAVANSFSIKNIVPKRHVPFADNRKETTAQRKLQRAANSSAAPKFITDKEAFLSSLQSEVYQVADEVLSQINQSAADCPYIVKWFSHYADKDAAYIEKAISRFAPATVSAGNTEEYISIIVARVKAGLQNHVATGSISDVPEEILVAQHKPKEFLHIAQRSQGTAQLAALCSPCWGNQSAAGYEAVAPAVPVHGGGAPGPLPLAAIAPALAAVPVAPAPAALAPIAPAALPLAAPAPALVPLAPAPAVLPAPAVPIDAGFTPASIECASIANGLIGSIYFGASGRIRLVHNSQPKISRHPGTKYTISAADDAQFWAWITPAHNNAAVYNYISQLGSFTPMVIGAGDHLVEFYGALGAGGWHVSRGGPRPFNFALNQAQVNAIYTAANLRSNAAFRLAMANDALLATIPLNNNP